MAINPPVDATKTPEWAALQKHYDELQSEGISLKQWFADDAERVEKLSFDAGDLHFDLSKNLIKPETLQLFADLAKAVKLDERTKAMYTGVHINNTEDRAVLHTALRRPAEDEGKYIVDGQDTVKDVREVLGRIYAFADKVRSGEWTGVSGKKIETVVNIGIGGSDLGPVMVYEALKPYADAGISARYISNIDPNDLAEKTKGLDPETTLFIVVSKTFTTLETLTNAREARTWLLDALKAAGAVDGSDEKNAEAIKKHFVGEGVDAVKHLAHVLDGVLTVDDVLALVLDRAAQRGVQHGAVLGVVDVHAGVHRLGALVELDGLGEVGEQLEGLRLDQVLGQVEVQVAGVERQLVDALGVIGEPLLEADALGLQLVIVLLQRGPLGGLGGVNWRIDGHGIGPFIITVRRSRLSNAGGPHRLLRLPRYSQKRTETNKKYPR